MTKEKEIELTGINFKIGNRELTLTTEEAKKLKNCLDDLFKQEIVIQRVTPVYPYGQWFYYQTSYYGAVSGGTYSVGSAIGNGNAGSLVGSTVTNGGQCSSGTLTVEIK